MSCSNNGNFPLKIDTELISQRIQRHGCQAMSSFQKILGCRMLSLGARKLSLGTGTPTAAQVLHRATWKQRLEHHWVIASCTRAVYGAVCITVSGLTGHEEGCHEGASVQTSTWEVKAHPRVFCISLGAVIVLQLDPLDRWLTSATECPP